MSNPLYTLLNGNNQTQDLIRRFDEFQKQFTGDPRQQIQQMLNTGQITQQQLDQAIQQANQLQKLLGK